MFAGLSRIVGPPVARRQLPAGALVIPFGHGRLTVSSTTQLLLSAVGQGNVLTVNRRPRIIPAAGLTISNTGLSASTLYYAYCNEGMALELSTTAPAVDGLTGLKVKSGDPTRTLVGLTFTNVSSQFVDIQTVSWFDRRNKQGSNSSTSTSTGSGLATVTFVTWAEESIVASSNYTNTNSSATAVNSLTLNIDGSTVGTADRQDTGSATGGVSMFGTAAASLSEGNHTFAATPGTNGAITSASMNNYVTVRG